MSDAPILTGIVKEGVGSADDSMVCDQAATPSTTPPSSTPTTASTACGPSLTDVTATSTSAPASRETRPKHVPRSKFRYRAKKASRGPLLIFDDSSDSSDADPDYEPLSSASSTSSTPTSRRRRTCDGCPTLTLSDKSGLQRVADAIGDINAELLKLDPMQRAIQSLTAKARRLTIYERKLRTILGPHRYFKKEAFPVPGLIMNPRGFHPQSQFSP